MRQRAAKSQTVQSRSWKKSRNRLVEAIWVGKAAATIILNGAGCSSRWDAQ
jgi:hypothetical protein